MLPDSIAAFASFPVAQILVGFTLDDLPSIGTKSCAPRFRFRFSDMAAVEKYSEFEDGLHPALRAAELYFGVDSVHTGRFVTLVLSSTTEIRRDRNFHVTQPA